ELFAGYRRYVRANQIWNRVRRIPPLVRTLTAGSLLSIPVSKWDWAFKILRPILPAHVQRYVWGDKLHKVGSILGNSQCPRSFYRSLMSKWDDAINTVLGAPEPQTLMTDPNYCADLRDLGPAAMAFDLISYLPGDIMAKVDRASMGVSLETRAPFLDHRLV